MLPHDLQEILHTKPFRPFRLTLSDGQTHDVRFRESFVLTPTYLMIGLAPNTEGTLYAKPLFVDLLNIISVEYLPVVVNPQGNGHPPS